MNSQYICFYTNYFDYFTYTLWYKIPEGYSTQEFYQIGVDLSYKRVQKNEYDNEI